MKKKFSMTLMQKETISGAIVFVLFLIALLTIHTQSSLKQDKTDFTLYASFAGTDGIMKGSAVRLGGVPVGTVTDMSLTPEYRVRVRLSFDSPVELSADTSAIIETDGLMGPKHVELIPGGEEDLLANEDEILYTQDAVVLNDLLSKVIGFMQNKKQNDSKQESTSENKD